MQHLCKEDPHRRRRRRHRRMPTFGKQRTSVVGSPLQTVFTFAPIPGLRRGHTHDLDKCLSPAGFHPVTEGVTGHLRRVYEGLRGHGETELSRAGFEDFIHKTQRDDKKPSWHLSTKCESFTFEQFEQYWWTEYSTAKKPLHRDDKDLDMPISNYFISSSHNTYIEDGNQFSGIAKADQYRKVLQGGCRCVEIDVWNGEDADDDTDKPFLTSIRSTEGKEKRHWSISTLLSWMKDKCHETRSMSLPKTLKSKQSEASFKARPMKRARAISDMIDPETLAKMLKREPRVCHAYPTIGGDIALHEAIPFRTVCETIMKHAFKNGNDLPVIISLEVHANVAQQEMMVKIMKEVFGDRLLTEQLLDCNPNTKQPTVKQLKGRIFIKTKTGAQVVRPAASNSEFDAGSTLQGSEPSECGYSLSTQTWHTASRETHNSHKDASKNAVADVLKKLAIYAYGPGHFEKFSNAKDADQPAHIYSIGEERVKELHRTEHHPLFKHNKSFLARSFPEGLLSMSSANPNYPTLFWRKGIQMVALNWQHWDTAMELNSAMFDNEDGWVLKPPGYRSTETSNCQAHIFGKKRMDLTITVLAGQHIPVPSNEETQGGTRRLNAAAVNDEKFRPRVTCFLHVESSAERDPKKTISSKDEISRKTRTARTDQPDWGANGSKLHFPGVHHVVEELSFVRFHVENCRRGWNERAAWACIRLDRLQQGYRLIKLKDHDGYPGDGMLLVKIEKKLVDEQPRPSSLSKKTWNVCKDEVSQLKSKWSCMG